MLNVSKEIIDLQKKTNIKTRHNKYSVEQDIFSPELFHDHANIIIDKLKTYLSDDSIRGLHLISPSILEEEAKTLMTRQHSQIADFNEERLKAIVDLYIKTGIQVYSPGAMGRQFSGVVPLAGIIDFVSSILSQPSSFYEAAQLPSVAEHIMANELNELVGYESDRFRMITTSGGSLANLTALLAARNNKFPEIWSKGTLLDFKNEAPAIAISEDVHYSITRAIGILGIGENQIVRLPINDKKQICANKVQATLDKAKKDGLNVFCMVATAGTTSIGAFDPIDKLAELAKKNNIWLHIDGAHGASFLVSNKLKHKLKGIEKADSFCWDAHKTMFVPPSCTLLFYKNRNASNNAFHQKASYVFEKNPDMYTEYDSGENNFECTKRPLIMNLWVLWAIYGKALFSDKIEYLCQLTSSAYEILKGETDFEIIHEPEANMLCFRYKPQNLKGINISDYQVEIRNEVRKNGMFFISKVDIDNEAALRVVFMNHETSIEHFKMLLNEIKEIGQIIIAKY